MRTTLVLLATVLNACSDAKQVLIDSTSASQAVLPSVGPTFEVGLWPGEGIPIIHAIRATLPLLQAPFEGALVVGVLSTRPGEQLIYDSTRFQTIKPSDSRTIKATSIRGRDLGPLRYLPRDKYYSGSFRDTTIEIAPPDTVEYLQYRAEGTCFVRVRARVINADPCPVFDTTAFTPPDDPQTLWWIYARGTNTSGWLLLTDSTAKAVDRRF
jgi:hypothetical protein